jgi:hypothetical protein
MSTTRPVVGPLELAGDHGRKPPGFDAFLGLSAALTGFSVFELQGTGVGGQYLATLRRIVPSATRDLLAAWRAIEQAPPAEGVDQAVRARILDDPRLGPVARNVITLWYTGSWAQMPDAWRYANGASRADVAHMVSALAYQESLVWKAAGTHPMGANEPGFGTWALPPA